MIILTGVDKCKYLGALFTKNSNSNEEINNGVNKGRNVIRSLNSILWDKSLRKKTKKRMYEAMVWNVMIYGAEEWEVNRKNGNKLSVTEVDYLRRRCRRTRLYIIRKETIREIMEMEMDNTDEVQKRQLMWFGYTKRMDETRWPREAVEWVPQEKGDRGRPRRD
jgi:hypothetical protein